MNHVALPTINGIALCAGVGMLDEGVRLAFEYLGFDYRAVCYVEREVAAAAQLVALMEAGCMDPAPIWSDLTTFDTRRWRGCVDVFTAGFPCQPHSVAGKREGLGDVRWIWPDIARLVGELRPTFVLLENVPGLAATGGLDASIGDLAERGYDAEWARLSAAAVGASHERERLFIFAWLADNNREGCGIDSGAKLLDGIRTTQRHHTHGCDPAMENAARHERTRLSGKVGNSAKFGRREGRPELSRRSWRPDPAGTSGELADASGARSQERTGGGRDDEALRPAERPNPLSIRRAFAPGPSDEVWEAYCSFFPFLAPAVESGICVLADGLALVVDESRTDQLREIGNGVVALTAACAYVELARRAGIA